MLTPSTPSRAKRSWATAQSRARNASTSAAERFLGTSEVRRHSSRKLSHVAEESRQMPVRCHQRAGAEADGVEYGGVLREEPAHELTEAIQALGHIGGSLAGVP